MGNYFDQFDPPAAPQAPANYFDQFDTPKTVSGQSPASTMGYIGTQGLGGFLEGGKQLGTAAAIEMGQPRQQADMQALPSGQQTANQMVYGQPNILPPNGFAQYGGAVANALGSNPVMAYIAPGYTVAGALGGEGGSDINKSVGGPLPDWSARLLGGLIGGGAYGGVKSAAANMANPASAADTTLAKIAQTKSAIEGGQGMYGEFQQKANAAANSLTSIKPPTVNPAAPIQMSKTMDILTTPNSPVPEGAAQLADTLNRTNGALPYGTVRSWLNQVGPGPLYTAINSDLKSSIGPQAAAQLEQSNLANQAGYFLNKAVTPSGFFDPQQLTKALAKTPQGEAIGAITPEMDAMTTHAGQITDMLSPWYKGSVPAPSAVSQAVRKLATVGAAIGTGHLTGNPEIGGVLAGYLLGHTEPTARMANLLYGINQPSTVARIAPWAIPSASSGLLSTGH